MRRTVKNRWGLMGILLLLPLSGTSAAEKRTAPSVPPTQQQTFQLGYALQAPTAQAEQYLQAAKALKTVSDDSEVTLEIGKLAKLSAALRASERRAYRQAAQRLRVLQAPSELQAWAEHAETRLAAPLIVSQKEKEGSDPDTATVLGTIDEAQDLKTNGDRHLNALLSCVKLT